MNKIVEEWRNIPGYEDYQVSNLERVKSLKFGKEKILKPVLNGLIGNRYYQVVLSKDGKRKIFRVHQLACLFLNT